MFDENIAFNFRRTDLTAERKREAARARVTLADSTITTTAESPKTLRFPSSKVNKV